jgi:hypothetical protein
MEKENKEKKKKELPEIDGMPVFPFKPDSMKVNNFRVIESGDLKTDDDIGHLIYLLFREPECDFFYYYQDGGPIDSALQKAVNAGDILMRETEWRYFRHPKFKRDYIKIPKHDIKWEWEKEVAEKGPEFVKARLELSARKRTEIEALQKVELEEYFRKKVREQKYNYDVFLSYSDLDRDEANSIYEAISSLGGRVFMAPKVIDPGEDFAEEVRQALAGSKELWLLVSPNSIKSEWVISEWGAAWVLKKRIVPILLRCAPDTISERLRRLQCIDMHKCFDFIKQKFEKKNG